jgi:hypothetical protein
MKALVVNCTLKGSPEKSNTEALAEVVADALRGHDPRLRFTIPGQAWTYWNKGPGPGEDYSETEEGHEWSHSTGRAAAANLLAVARALEAKPIPAPTSE